MRVVRDILLARLHGVEGLMGSVVELLGAIGIAVNISSPVTTD
jgi:hypothetical protein